MKFYLTFGLLVCATATAQESKETDVRIEKDVAFLGPDRTQRLDLYIPPLRKTVDRVPGILIIHGGGWVKGDKAAKREINIGTTLAKAGYVCASINYQLGQSSSSSFAVKLHSAWPQNIHDCKTAVRWMRKNADKYGIDAEKIGVIGGSAGGHLTALLGVTDEKDGLEGDGPYQGFSTKVQAIVPMYPPADLEFRMRDKKLEQEFSDEQKALCKVAAPVTYASSDDPPALILHGTNDKLVSPEQSRRLAAAFRKAGVKYHLEIIDGAPHSFHLQPKQKDLRPLVTEFFDRHLKRKT